MSQFDPGSFPPPGVPVPAQALVYSTPLAYRRPGIVTAIGVMAIVIGCLSVMASLGSGMNAWGFLMMSRITARMSRTMTTLSAPPAPPAPAAPLSVGEVGVAVNTLSPMLALDGPHERELDRMLRLHGREIFGGDEDTPLTAAMIRQDVTLSRKMRPSGSQPARLMTAEGAVDVYADHAVFKSSDGTTTIDTSARNNRDSTQTPGNITMNVHATAIHPGGARAIGPASMTLTPAQIRSVVSAVKSAATTPLNSRQIQSLQTELAKPKQSLVMPRNAGQVPAVISYPNNGNVGVYFNTGSMLMLGPAGQVISSGPPPMPKFNVNPGVAALVMIEAVCSAALAIYLVVAGIIVLRGSFAAPRLLRIYAWTKIPLAILAGAAVGLLWYQFYMGISSTPGFAGASAGSFAPVGIMYGMVLGVLGLAFPIGLLIALRSRTVRGYFNAVVSGA